ncbi:helix-turn-helix domain-containing protein [Thalassococcus sp. S3]|uniref:helix-turn-helix domain-containing protein n=1 Tax=Thalassococcus sp. S3 TaxID=2017482 RepID=UPI0013EE7C95|nr:helix-turn-helix domain-containing protein [Thalassococcus sp. S3]
MSDFGPVLKEIRLSLGLSQASCAATLQSTQRHISFLETGRSQPSPGFVARICRELGLSIAQRAALFESAGLQNPYVRRSMQSDDVQRALDLIAAQVLDHWPFPALVMDRHWTILRANEQFINVFSSVLPAGNTAPNLIDVMLSPAFLPMITNWHMAAATFYFRLQRGAAQSTQVAERFRKARAGGLFDLVERELIQGADVPPMVPIELTLPNGAQVRLTSLIGHLAGCQDAAMEGCEVELIVPFDDTSETVLRDRTRH